MKCALLIISGLNGGRFMSPTLREIMLRWFVMMGGTSPIGMALLTYCLVIRVLREFAFATLPLNYQGI